MFWRRALSVAVLAPLVLLIVYQGDWLYLILVSVVVVMMQVEYCRLAQHFTEKLNPVMPALLSGVFCLFAYFLPELTQTTAASTVIFSYFTFVFIYIFAESIFRAKVAGELLAVTLKLTGILTIGWALGYHLILLRNAEPIGRQLIFLLAGIIWCSDTGAYLVGRAFGKHKLGTPVSPRKTIEGTIGGLVVGTLTSFLLNAILLKGTLSWGHAIFIGLLLSVLGQLGDLSASLMKRTAGVKDSGQVIPGHGGFIDRCDSLIFSTPVLYYYLALTGHLG
ncbi:phosphatidate cytidylyltransferase [Candidatus Poribacteria bacterium]|nr:phosphatidate cytidylyltransferase [Candidatus Poribacteria bacterium]MXV85288.1 phosphatidate cytidylyltransferase [Candidatus Poribacteria bacterium]MYA58671.1 phosphatidate cytidylyltransferase [Candidatus Poribacteria bacterium]